MLPRLRRVTIAVVYTWPGGGISLWPVPNAEETRIACWKSARAAYDLSKEQWVQLVWNNDLRDYDVASIILGLQRRRWISGFVEIPLELRDPYGLAMLACIITSTPGTLWVDFSQASGTLTIHVLDPGR